MGVGDTDGDTVMFVELSIIVSSIPIIAGE